MVITLKDGSSKEYLQPMSIIDIATDISEGLARMACAGEINGEVKFTGTIGDIGTSSFYPPQRYEQ